MFKVKRESKAENSTEQGFKPGPARRAVLLAPKSETSDVLIRNLSLFNVETRMISELDVQQPLNPSPHFIIIDIENVDSIRKRMDGIKKWGEANKVRREVV